MKDWHKAFKFYVAGSMINFHQPVLYRSFFHRRHTKREELLMKGKIVIMTVLCLICCRPALASDVVVGSIKSVKGTASIVRNKKSIDTKIGTTVLRGDSMKTGSGSSLAMVFKDDTLLAIGADSEISVNDFLFSPAQGKLSFVARLVKGTAACVTGIIAKLSPESVRFETPVANIGVRGTMFAVKIEGSGE
jgi:hypothetical protein